VPCRLLHPGERLVRLRQGYHHLNTAWNARESQNAMGQASDTEFREWSAFPTDLPMFERTPSCLTPCTDAGPATNLRIPSPAV
jgi:hypothetical protein